MNFSFLDCSNCLHFFFCQPHMLLERFPLPGGGESDRKGQRVRRVLFVVGGKLFVNAGQDHPGGVLIHLWQEDGELVAAETADDVFGTEGLRQQAGGIDHTRIAGFVSVLLIERFQPAHLGGEDGDREQARFFQAGELGLKEQAVIKAG